MKRLWAVLAAALLLAGCAGRASPSSQEALPALSYWEAWAPSSGEGYSRLAVTSWELEPLTGDGDTVYTYYEADFIQRLWDILDRPDWTESNPGHDHAQTLRGNGAISLQFYNGLGYPDGERDSIARYDTIVLYSDGCARVHQAGDDGIAADDADLFYEPGAALYNRLLQKLLDHGLAGVETVRPADCVKGIDGNRSVVFADGRELSLAFLKGDTEGRRLRLLLALGAEPNRDWDKGALPWRFVPLKEGLPGRPPDLSFQPRRFEIYAQEELAVVYDGKDHANWYALPPGAGRALLELMEEWAAA